MTSGDGLIAESRRLSAPDVAVRIPLSKLVGPVSDMSTIQPGIAEWVRRQIAIEEMTEIRFRSGNCPALWPRNGILDERTVFVREQSNRAYFGRNR